jgi:A/G-specific adenine glycosylase
VKRRLPWRERSNEPYAVLVSEVMLQQTQADIVARYYEPFLRRFPNVAALADAAESEVLASWSGLGYYRRARNLQHAAHAIRERGSWPRSAQDLRALPGVGEYTAAAVASIAFGEVTLALDGNGERVLARLLALEQDPRRVAGRRAILAAGRALLDVRRPGDSNQALMELGATVCRPQTPRCGICPLAESCAGRALGIAEHLPVRAPRRERVAVRWALAVVHRGVRLLLSRRPATLGLSHGLWSLPTIELESGGSRISDDELAVRFAAAFGGDWKVVGNRAVGRHSVTYRDVELLVSEARVSSLRCNETLRYFSTRELDDLPTTAVLAKALAALGGSRGPGSQASGSQASGSQGSLSGPD